MARRITTAAFYLCAGWAAIQGASLVFSYDIWWHLAQGRWSWEHAAVARTDVLSHTFAGKPLAYQEVAGEVLVYLLVSAFGPKSLSILTAAAAAGVFVLFWKLARGTGLAAEPALLLAVAAFVPAARFMVAEFSTFSILFFCVFLHAGGVWLRTGRNLLLWLLVPLEFLWANTHRGAILAPPLALLIAIEALSAQRRLWLQMLVFVSLVCAASLANPSAGSLFTSSLDVVTRFDMAGFTKFWQPLSPAYAFKGNPMLGVLLVAALAAAFIGRKKLGVFAVFSFFLAAAACARGIRWAALPAAACLPVLGGTLRGSKIERFFARHDLIFSAVILCSALALFGSSALTPGTFRGFGHAKWLFPERSAAFVLSNKPAGALYHSFNFGGFLAWKLSPEYGIFIDGRNESLFSFDFLRQAWEAEESASTWDELAERYGVNLAVVETNPDLSLFDFLDAKPGWALVFLEENAAVFARDIPRHRRLIERYAYRELAAVNPVKKLEEISGDPKRLYAFHKEALRFTEEAPDSPKAFFLAALSCARLGIEDRRVCDGLAAESNKLTFEQFEGRSLFDAIFGGGR